MAVLETNVVVNAPVSKVFSFTNDPKRQHEWLPGVVSVDVTPGKVGHIGEVWTMVYSSGGMRSKVKCTILEYEENKKTVWEVSSVMMDEKVVQIYEPLGPNATRHVLHNEFRLKGFMGVLGPLMVPMVKRGFRRGAETMKRICETEAGKPA